MQEPILFYHFIPYILLVSICFFSFYFPIKGNIGAKIIFSSLLIFAAIRYEVGWDFRSYRAIIESQNTDDLERVEWASKFLIIIAKNTFTQFYFIANTIIGLLFLNCVLKRFSSNIVFSYYIYLTFSLFYLQSMDIIRNFTAILVMMYACQMFLDKKYWRYLLLIFIAAGFHTSAYIGFLIPIVYFAVFKLNFSWMANLIFFILSFGSGKAIEMFILSLSDNAAFEKVAYYIINNTEGSGDFYKYIFYFINIVFIINWNRLVKENDMNRLWITLINVGVCLWIVFSFQYTLSLRMALSFIIWMIILIPSFVDTFRPSVRKLAKQCIIVFFTILFFTNLFILANAYNSGVIYQAGFLPYKVFFFE